MFWIIPCALYRGMKFVFVEFEFTELKKLLFGEMCKYFLSWLYPKRVYLWRKCKRSNFWNAYLRYFICELFLKIMCDKQIVFKKYEHFSNTIRVCSVIWNVYLQSRYEMLFSLAVCLEIFGLLYRQDFEIVEVMRGTVRINYFYALIEFQFTTE